MKMLKKLENLYKKNESSVKTVFFYFATLLLIYIMFMHFYITNDHVPSYYIENRDMTPNLKSCIAGGRVLGYIISWIYVGLGVFHVSHLENIYVIQVLGLVLYAITAYLIQIMYEKEVGNKESGILVKIPILMMFVNPLMVETFVYGAFDWAVGIFIAICSARAFTLDKWWKGAILTFLAVTTYQSNVFIILSVACGILLIRYMSSEEKIIVGLYKQMKVTVVSAAMAACTIVFQEIAAKLLQINELVKEATIGEDVLQRIQICVMCFKESLVYMYGMLPKFFYCGILLGLLLFVFVGMWAKTNCSSNVIMYVFTNVLCIIAPFSLGIVTYMPFFPQRVLFSLFFAIGMFFLVVYRLVENHRLGIIRNLYMMFVMVVGIVLLYSTETCIMDCYIGQALDINEAKRVQDEIKEYEKSTGNEVSEIITYVLPGNMILYDEQFNEFKTYSYARRKVSVDWSRVSWMNYVNGTDYKKRDMTEEEYNKYFSVEHMNVFNPSKQMVFDGEKLYWVIY